MAIANALVLGSCDLYKQPPPQRCRGSAHLLLYQLPSTTPFHVDSSLSSYPGHHHLQYLNGSVLADKWPIACYGEQMNL